ncbi:MAG: glutamate synthase subunit alpha, partial [Vicinamibacterales bacterium]
ETRADSVDLEWLLHDARSDTEAPTRFVEHIPMQRARSELGQRVKDDAIFAVRTGDRAVLHYPITNADRTVGAELGGEIAYHFGEESPPGEASVRFVGQAGQSFGAFLASGVDFTLVGEANDYVGKGMHGGEIVIRPASGTVQGLRRAGAASAAQVGVIAGNTALYGATGGRVFIAGAAGERFAVRNSGATAVVEGVGDHACEYMTGGRVVVLGATGRNFAAGMSGGIAFVLDADDRFQGRCNQMMVDAVALDDDDWDVLAALLMMHYDLTSSRTARELLDLGSEAAAAFWKVVPKGISATRDREEPAIAASPLQITQASL